MVKGQNFVALYPQWRGLVCFNPKSQGPCPTPQGVMHSDRLETALRRGVWSNFLPVCYSCQQKCDVCLSPDHQYASCAAPSVNRDVCGIVGHCFGLQTSINGTCGQLLLTSACP